MAQLLQWSKTALEIHDLDRYCHVQMVIALSDCVKPVFAQQQQLQFGQTAGTHQSTATPCGHSDQAVRCSDVTFDRVQMLYWTRFLACSLTKCIVRLTLDCNDYLRHASVMHISASCSLPCLTAYCIRLSMMQAFYQALQISAFVGTCIWNPIYKSASHLRKRR